MLLSRSVAGILLVVLSGVVSAQTYPDKPLRIITAAVGGGSDYMSRVIAQGISGPLGQPVVIDNRAGGIIAAEAVAKAPPDGYTLLVSGPILWITPLLRKTPYDAVKDFAPISLASREVYVIAVHPSMPVRSIKELIALAKARPGELNYSSATAGGNSHIAAELFKSMAGVNIVRIPYKGNSPAITALISGEVQVTLMDANVMAADVKSGRLRALAVTSAEPSALTPGLPTVAATVPGFETTGMTGIFAPARTPGPIITRLNQEIVRFVNGADVKERFLGAGIEVVTSTPEQFGATIKSDIAKMDKVIRDAGIKID